MKSLFPKRSTQGRSWRSFTSNCKYLPSPLVTYEKLCVEDDSTKEDAFVNDCIHLQPNDISCLHVIQLHAFSKTSSHSWGETSF